ncbi:MAG: hypothetical protein DRG78_06225 [Epsilonproteobacteria bacterium]|nr:MAG: hypothetical protein DRG78_06225 [Campylobacterota bacterium]
MSKFIINKNAQENGDHEVHNETTGCSHMPNPENRIDVGNYNSCQEAVADAKRKWPDHKVDGCYYCCNSAHTS